MKQKVLEELRLSCAIVLSREEVVPRFRLVCPEGDWTVFVPLPRGPAYYCLFLALSTST